MRRQCPLSVTMCFINMNMQFMSRSSSSTHSIHYDIVAFVVSILLTLVQIRYPSEDLFRTHYKTMVVVMSSLLAYCFVFGVISYIDHAYGPYGRRYGLKHNWCCMAMMAFGLVPVVSLLSLLFPDSAWRPVLYLMWVRGSLAPGARLAPEIGATSDEGPSSVARKEDITTFATDLNGFVKARSQ